MEEWGNFDAMCITPNILIKPEKNLKFIPFQASFLNRNQSVKPGFIQNLMIWVKYKLDTKPLFLFQDRFGRKKQKYREESQL